MSVKCEATKARACFHIEIWENYHLLPKITITLQQSHLWRRGNRIGKVSHQTRSQRIANHKLYHPLRRGIKLKEFYGPRDILKLSLQKLYSRTSPAQHCMDGHDGWSRGGILNETKVPMRLKRLKRMKWSIIVGS